MGCLDDLQERNRSRKSSKSRTVDSPPVAKKSRSFQMDVINIALEGDCGPLNEYIDGFDMSRAKSQPLTAAEWERVLPAWKSKEKSRGLKGWRSKSARGEWSIGGVCAKVINKSVSIYMEIFGLPPVVEGERGSGSHLSATSGGIDLYTPFLLTVHKAYCQNLNPEVEDGMVAYDKVMVYVLD